MSFAATCFGIGFRWFVASMLARSWYVLNVIFKFFRDRFVDDLLDGISLDYIGKRFLNMLHASFEYLRILLSTFSTSMFYWLLVALWFMFAPVCKHFSCYRYPFRIHLDFLFHQHPSFRHPKLQSTCSQTHKTHSSKELSIPKARAEPCRRVTYAPTPEL